MKYAIQLEHVTKKYGSDRGVIDVNVQVPVGSVFGFLGPNGAGKTTTISMLMNLTHPTAGTIRVFGRDNEIYGLQNRSKMGFLAGDMALDRGLTGLQQLRYFGHLRGEFDETYVMELADRLGANLRRKIKKLSRGNRQKIGLIAALMNKPDLLVLDEPTNGLDPLVQAEFNKIILEQKKAGKTTFISSHVLSEVQELCDELAIIREGEIVTHTSLKELVRLAPRSVSLRTDGSYDPQTVISGLEGVGNIRRHDHSISFSFAGDINDLLRRIAKKPLQHVAIQEAGLEDIFMSYYEGGREKQKNA